MSLAAVGSQATDFTLTNQHGESVQLSSFFAKKNIVLYFYPRASTPGCTVQACGMRDYHEELAKRDAVCLAVSPDSVRKLFNFSEKQSLNFDLLSDEDTAVAQSYGVWALKKFMGREFMGILRTTFIIDKEGVIRHVMDKVKTKTHNDDVLALLDQLEA